MILYDRNDRMNPTGNEDEDFANRIGMMFGLNGVRWEIVSHLILLVGGILLLYFGILGWESLGEMTIWLSGGLVGTILRVIIFFIGIVALVDIAFIVYEMMVARDSWRGIQEGMAGYMPVGQSPEDDVIRRGLGVGRVYLPPYIPNEPGVQPVSIRGTPGRKILYYPIEGGSAGAQNYLRRDALSQLTDPLELRKAAFGSGVVVLDERGRGAIMSSGSRVLYREVYGDGRLGAIHEGGYRPL